MSKYIERDPAAVDAFKWTGGPDQVEDPEWIVEELKRGYASLGGGVLWLNRMTPDETYAHPGEWIVRNGEGLIFCLPDSVFNSIYKEMKE